MNKSTKLKLLNTRTLNTLLERKLKKTDLFFMVTSDSIVVEDEEFMEGTLKFSRAFFSDVLVLFQRERCLRIACVLLCMQFGCSYDFFSHSGFIGFARSTLDPFSGGIVYLDVVFFGSG